jgi:hypothetical protein
VWLTCGVFSVFGTLGGSFGEQRSSGKLADVAFDHLEWLEADGEQVSDGRVSGFVAGPRSKVQSQAPKGQLQFESRIGQEFRVLGKEFRIFLASERR